MGTFNHLQAASDSLNCSGAKTEPLSPLSFFVSFFYCPAAHKMPAYTKQTAMGLLIDVLYSSYSSTPFCTSCSSSSFFFFFFIFLILLPPPAQTSMNATAETTCVSATPTASTFRAATAASAHPALSFRPTGPAWVSPTLTQEMSNPGSSCS